MPACTGDRNRLRSAFQEINHAGQGRISRGHVDDLFTLNHADVPGCTPIERREPHLSAPPQRLGEINSNHDAIGAQPAAIRPLGEPDVCRDWAFAPKVPPTPQTIHDHAHLTAFWNGTSTVLRA